MNGDIEYVKKVKTLEEKKREAIGEIQKYLIALSKAGMDVPPLKIDGIYGTQTREAVRIFQALMGIPVTGIVDIITWDILYSEYLSALEQSEKSEGIFPFEEIFEGGVVVPAQKGNIIYILQVMLETIADYYNDSVMQGITGEFDEATINNLRAFQRSLGIEETGILDKITWNALATVYNEYLNKN